MHISHSTPAGGIRSLSPSRGVKSPVVPVALKRFYCRAKRAKSGVPTFSTISANNPNCKNRFRHKLAPAPNHTTLGRGSVPAARNRTIPTRNHTNAKIKLSAKIAQYRNQISTLLGVPPLKFSFVSQIFSARLFSLFYSSM